MFPFSGAGVQTWVPEDNYLIYAAGSSTANQAMTFSGSPVDTAAGLLGTTRMINFVQLMIVAGGVKYYSGLKIPVMAGKTYYVRSDGISCLFLWLEPAVQLTI